MSTRLATARLRELVAGYNWTIEDTYAAQNMCPYETVSLEDSGQHYDLC
jgi:hypothetical protein